MITQLQGYEKVKLDQQVDAFNKQLNKGKMVSPTLGKDDFLKILVTQLSKQDPTQPMQDREFVAQMAQFSSLEQMTNMAKSFANVSGVIQSGQAMSTLGKHVEIQVGEHLVQGQVREVTAGSFPQVMVGDQYYDFSLVQKIYASEDN
jgi:flagellar basal-body rod modification protein FlgD